MSSVRPGNEIARTSLADGWMLIWRDEGSPYGNELEITLVDPQRRERDALIGGAALVPGILDIRRQRPDGADFTFFEKDRVFVLCASAHGFWTMGWHLPRGFRYRSWLQRHHLSLAIAPAD